jgi:hypothetical protein
MLIEHNFHNFKLLKIGAQRYDIVQVTSYNSMNVYSCKLKIRRLEDCWLKSQNANTNIKPENGNYL